MPASLRVLRERPDLGTRANFGARLEPEGVIMHGAGQDPVSYAGYWSAMPIGRQPSTFMGYVGLGTIAPN
jgi:hypothetical protein